MRRWPTIKEGTRGATESEICGLQGWLATHLVIGSRPIRPRETVWNGARAWNLRMEPELPMLRHARAAGKRKQGLSQGSWINLAASQTHSEEWSEWGR